MRNVPMDPSRSGLGSSGGPDLPTPASFLQRLRAAVPMADRRREDGLPPRGAVAVFLGDSVTAGWREWGILDADAAYPALWARALRKRYATAALSVINAGLGGSTAEDGTARFERDVLTHRPDLVVLCYGLNDAGFGERGLEPFRARIEGMVTRAMEAGAACIYLTPNPIYPPGIVDGDPMAAHLRRVVEWLPAYLDAGREAAARAGAAVADGYRRWLRAVEQTAREESAGEQGPVEQGGLGDAEWIHHPAMLRWMSNGLHHPNDAGHAVLAGVLLDVTLGRGG